MTPNFIILYVTNPEKQAKFYARLLGIPTLEASPNFSMLKFNGETMLGLWKADTVMPRPTAMAGAHEIAVSVATPGVVDALFADWSGQGISFAQQPTDLDFGRTCVALDADSHRIRILCAT